MIIRRQRQHESRMRSYYNRQPPAYPMIPRGDPFCMYNSQETLFYSLLPFWAFKLNNECCGYSVLGLLKCFPLQALHPTPLYLFEVWSDERYGTYGGELEDLNPPFELQRHLPRRPNPAADLDPSLGEQFGTSAIDRLQGIGAHSGNNLLSHNSVRSPRQQLPRARFL